MLAHVDWLPGAVATTPDAKELVAGFGNDLLLVLEGLSQNAAVLVAQHSIVIQYPLLRRVTVIMVAQLLPNICPFSFL